MARDGDTSMEENFPTELNDRLTAFDESLTHVDNVAQALHGKPLSQLHEKLSSLDKARLDLVGVYAVNSLFWMYLNCKGENPKEHGVKQELDRVRRYMDRVKEVQEKLKDKIEQPHLKKDAAKRFIRNALWMAAHNNSAGAERAPTASSHQGEGGPDIEIVDASVSGTGTKRAASHLTESEPAKKKKKKKKKKQNQTE